MSKKKFSLLFALDCLILLSLFLYSFTQVDLNLTLSRSSFFQSVQKFFIYIGYFQRPLSTLLFLIIVFLLFLFYFLVLYFTKKNRLTKRQVWWLIILTTGILLFSYPAFSHDVFNYMFDARIFTHYQLNPYYFKALDFPQDSWTRFMHWTHRNYPYGPTWILLTLPFSYLGFGKFLLTLFNFKILMSAAYLGAVYLVGRILKSLNSKEELLGITFFALNPLVIIESLVSAHNDIVMMFFALLAIYFIVLGRKRRSFLSLAVSIGIKYVTVFILPLVVLGFRKKLTVLLSILAFLYVLSQREIQPWYFLWVLPFVSLVPTNRLLTFLTFGFSLGLLLYYAPFLYFGNWDAPVPTIKIWVTITPLALSFLIFCLVRWDRPR